MHPNESPTCSPDSRLRRLTATLATLPPKIDKIELDRIEDFLMLASRECARLRQEVRS